MQQKQGEEFCKKLVGPRALQQTDCFRINESISEKYVNVKLLLTHLALHCVFVSQPVA